MNSDDESLGLPEEPNAGDGGSTWAHPSTNRLIALTLGAIAVIAALYLGLPQLAGVENTWARIDDGNPWWLAAAALFEALALGAHTWLFRTVFARENPLIGWRASYDITMAALAATRLLPPAGIGGWRCRRGRCIVPASTRVARRPASPHF